ncbi:MAG: hypothetical protein PHF56_20225 [Desulfuromonadaceae bacterium]|nr:hypothetical protein [Desulfuromonadaceae bacterium]
MKIDTPIGPFFIPKFKIDPSGVDFLGMRQANLELMETCLPGINNYTRYIRGFSVLSWIYWKFYDLMKAQEIDQQSSEALICFKEKIEILFTWGHHGLGLPKVPGIEAKQPASTNGTVELSFSAWKRDPDNTSLMAAPTYGPASKTTGGLLFLEPVEKDVFRAYGNGVQMAEALEKSLKDAPGYDFLTSLKEFKADENIAKGLFHAWDLRSPSDAEMAAFAVSFYDSQLINSATPLGRRSATVALVLELLQESSDPLAEKDIRIALSYRRLKSKPIMNLSKSLETAWIRWFILQIRQAHRLAFEAIFAWVEDRLIRHKDRDTVVLVDAIMVFLSEHEKIVPQGVNTADISGKLFTGMDTVEDYLDLADTDPDYCIFSIMENIQKSLKTWKSDVVPLALRLLLLCEKLSSLLEQHDDSKKLLGIGEVKRISLKYWQTVFSRFSARPLPELLRFIIENLVLSQHFGVAAFRFDGKKQRLRISVEEEGLVSLISRPLKPFVGEDRLAITLCLLADCGLITDIAKDYSQGLYMINPVR